MDCPCKETRRGDRAATVAGICAVAALVLAVAATLVWMVSCEVRANPEPSPTLAAADKTADDAVGAASEWPEVNWEHWISVNPDVVGWVSIPGTNVSQPIVQASADDPDYYLNHDVYRRYNPMGCPYLDASCTEGLASMNAVVMGHNWASSGVFADIAKMSDAAYASSHSTVLLQTPTERTRLEVQAVEVTSGDAPTKATSFASVAEIQAWYSERWAASCVRLSPDPILTDGANGGMANDETAADPRREAASMSAASTTATATPARILTLVTCSYAHDNDRTLLYAAEAAGGSAG